MTVATAKGVDQSDAADATPAVDLVQLAAHLATDTRSLRAFMRRTGRSVGRGTRYGWPSMKDPELKKIVTDWEAVHPK